MKGKDLNDTKVLMLKHFYSCSSQITN